jgi:hypothetical protein
LVIGLLLTLLIMTIIPVSAAVTLESFTVTPGNGQVLVAWEADETGFFPPVGPIVPGVARAIATQTSVLPRLLIATGLANTPTSTPTLTLPPPNISTATQIGTYPGPLQSPSPGPIQSPNPTQDQTSYPGPVTTPSVNVPGTPGADSTSINQPLLEGDPTSTLLPFPSITIEFPVSTQTPYVPIKSTPGPGDNGLSEWVNIARLGPLALILLVWVLLGGWFYLTLRRMD